ncbi:MAG: FKBP-type peptidyl-prolyl cis-trans isomerase [Verrucomicrobia bacterium]|jgi:FKBP-type peptidyl-prolyl cis-trans isomerase|nr:FKBP-type peptidyl-prolyl cis-trans isomerase [Verrucomicrobiota bacterium]
MTAAAASHSVAPMLKKLLAAALAASTASTTLMAQTALEKGQAFLAENAKKPGVQQTASGLQYTIEAPGEGTAPKPTDTVKVNYRGTLLDGTEFDSSYKRNEPIEFPLNGVIRGWTEGLQLIKPGGKIKLFIPSNLAYGSRGAGGVIGPDETLIFEVELLEVK